MEKRAIKSPRDLLVWQKTSVLLKEAFVLLRAIKMDFVSSAIISQVTRSLFSIRSNIVEGWYSHRGKSFASYLEIARGSVGETDDWFYALLEEKYISKEQYESITVKCKELIAMLTGFINKIRKNET